MLGQGVGTLLVLEAAGWWYLRSERGMGVQEGRSRARLFGVRRLGQEAVGFKRKTESGRWHLHACNHIDRRCRAREFSESLDGSYAFISLVSNIAVIDCYDTLNYSSF